MVSRSPRQSPALSTEGVPVSDLFEALYNDPVPMVVVISSAPGSRRPQGDDSYVSCVSERPGARPRGPQNQ